MISIFLKIINDVTSKLFKLHWPLIFLMAALSAAGILCIYSATHLSNRPELCDSSHQQMMWVIIGFGLFFILSFTDYRILINLGFWILAGVVILLIVTLIVAKPIEGAKRWLRIAGVGIQSAELAKLAFILSLTQLLIIMSNYVKTLRIIFAALALLVIPFVLILKQPDLGSAAVLLPITFFMLFAAGVRKRFLIIPIAGIVILYAICFTYVYKMEKELPFLKTYQSNRIRTFFDPKRDPRGAGWTISQSLIAVGSGGFKGKGFMKGDQNIYGFLPKNISYTDFIFSVIAEEFGFLGGVLLILGEGLVILCILQIAVNASSLSGVLLSTGIATMLFTHFFVNIGMTIKVVPITGIPLPFISYGGTFMLVCMASMGILQSIWIDRHHRSFIGSD